MKPFDFPFKVGEREYALRYTFKVRREYEKQHKTSVAGLMQRVANSDDQRADDLIDLIQLLTSSTHPELTESDIEKIIDDVGGEDVMMGILTQAIGGQSAGKDGEPNP